jgi:hypothetical protein
MLRPSKVVLCQLDKDKCIAASQREAAGGGNLGRPLLGIAYMVEPRNYE